MTGPAPFPPPRPRGLDELATIEVLRDGDLEIVGRLLASTNNALVGTVTRHCPDPEPDVVLACVYKPTIGERPLDDFPDGTLSHREVAAFLVSASTGWGIVPPTVYRDGPFGGGMVQQWVEVDETIDPVQLVIDGDVRLRRIAVFDAAVNNTDRKAGHLLPIEGGQIQGVDHGVCFSPVPKLRTVLWDWRGEPLATDELEMLERLRDELRGVLGEALCDHLAPHEVAAMIRRVERLLKTGRFPQPDPRRPALPWPPV